MVRLTLQPLIENAFQHAFPDGIEASQYIMISAGCDDDSFWVSVTDNGIGMTDEQRARLRHGCPTSTTT